MRQAVAALALGVTLSLPMQDRETCVLDQAQVVAVPPDTFQVMSSVLCGEIRCWERYAQIGDQRVALGRVCERSDSASSRRDLAPAGGG